ncbi:MAG: hypothetical protein BECKG1743D_GA0114223_1004610 [Candidatus Kentron sp. G]|nr:MAG: hypothetical protein BECKG1743E_GA0114224_100428 [Candidatus Kentron sp. G]VFM98132.1 MAG: hypothetical protein BECKG1743D_GA0114223_1004610 [Candidatus Kentron sp. G]VFN04053.1 MAG: hypothetical protein BECKG1743F_GA0114225_108821 [Candidatus Kentron sp. G]
MPWRGYESVLFLAGVMSVKNMTGLSETDWERIDALTDEQIDTSDIPPLSESFFAHATLRMPRRFTTVTVQVDPDVWAWYASQGEDCGRRLNAALRMYSEAQMQRA